MSPPLRFPPTMGANPHRTPLPNPALAPTAVEMRREHGPNEAQERRSVAANSFRLLQQSGLVPAEARLEAAAPRGGTWRSRMEELVTDQNRNGRFDIDLARVRDSGLVRPGTTVEQLDRAIAADIRQNRPTDEFLTREHPREPWVTPQDRADARGTADIRFRNPNAWGVETYDTAAEVRAEATSPERAGSLARQAVSAAQVMEGRGDVAGARALLDHTSQGLQEAHQFPAARQVTAQLQRAPVSAGEINVIQAQSDAIRAAHPEFDPRQHVISSTSPSGNRTDLRESGFHPTAGNIAERRNAQMDQVERMEGVLGHRVDPHNLDQAQAYLQQYSRGHSTDQVRQEYGSYLGNFYAHAGQGVTWNATAPVNDRPAMMSRWLPEQPSTSDGRRLIDCEGFIYLNQRILPTLQDERGQQRFNLIHGGNQAHVISVAEDRRTREGFTINNERVGPMLRRHELGASAEQQLPGGRFSPILSRVDEQGTLD